MGRRKPSRVNGELDIMRKEPDTTQNTTPPITIKTPWRVKQVKPVAGYQLQVEFMDATEGLVDLSKLINSEQAGVFAQLKDQKTFNHVYVEYGTVTWQCGLDLAPDTMYRMIQQNPEHVYVVGR
ncbi:MAG: hypothetical protein B7Z05_01160 [Thiotrichales bacterium 32-46-8]|nr:MAG: hypothetical protein B7Z05_01160 [Thiotrichales bacterium 32-46-8]OYY23652.1 MAG: hypothetical protein B7Y68_05615 [Thiotrichales bacterium 35-46-9]OYZ07004.1 MAG: hypothetical protein B7Y29_05030 [Thiotrichales bacterium 16-46-22]OZA18101.1 MAG: hypothetical protein B7X85_04195 [Thiotrichales bacterium 17-46-47]OZA75320.1 MAG: hypothetical protein B7X74_00580 [Thiotrichales bacterium 39-47-5]